MCTDIISAAADAPRLAKKARQSQKKAKTQGIVHKEQQESLLSLGANLIKKNSLPKVSGDFGTFDVSLGFSHRYAIEIATKTLVELREDEVKVILDGLWDVFEKWKNEHGVYPPKLGGLLGALNSNKEPEPARDYIERQALAEVLSGEEPKYIEPWECHSHARTPVRLFGMLFVEDYPPLKEFMEKTEYARYDYILAMTILMTHNSDKEYQSSDCIDAGMRLALARLDILQGWIKKMEPLARETFNRKRNASKQRKIVKEETEQKVLTLHQKFLEDGSSHPYKVYADQLGVSEATISRYLTKNGISKHKS